MNERTWALVKAGLVAGGAFVLVLIVGNLPFLFLFELKGLDLLFLLRGSLPPPPEIVIVAIDEPSFTQVSKQWPWPRSVHAQLIEKLEKAGAKVIGFDVLFTEQSQRDDDRALQRAIQKGTNVVLVSEQVVINDPLFRYTSRVDPIEALKEVATVGLSSLQIYPDGSVRRARLGFPDIPSFALQVARRYIGEQSSQRIENHSHGTMGGKSFDPSAEMLINYLGPPRTVKTVSYYQALDYERTLAPGVF